jgi:hypothetical protein
MPCLALSIRSRQLRRILVRNHFGIICAFPLFIFFDGKIRRYRHPLFNRPFNRGLITVAIIALMSHDLPTIS